MLFFVAEYYCQCSFWGLSIVAIFSPANPLLPNICDPQAHILEFGLAVHEKFVPQDMRPLHKKLVDQFHLMKSSLGIQVSLLHSSSPRR